MDTTYFINGAISGSVGIILSHPIDTLKTRIQSNNTITYNPRILYKGIFSPLIGVGFEKAIVFGTYQNCYKYLNNKNVSNNINNFISGGIAGFSASFVVTPVERIKILIQSNNKIHYSNLNIKYLYNGLSATFTRETPGFAIYFTVYENLKYNFYSKYNQQITLSSSFIFGGLSGGFAWIFIYPQDRIKTIIQSQNKSLPFFSVIKNLYLTYGLKSFYKGFSLALLRAIPLLAGVFMTN